MKSKVHTTSRDFAYNDMHEKEEEEEKTDQIDLENEEEGEEIEQDDQEDQEEEKINEEDEDDKSLKKTYYKCKYAVENSSRFSLRVMEAMRSLQNHGNVLPISSRKEIVDYISKNYNNDGDLNAQVQTSLKQLCTQGFVTEVLNDEYQLIGPFSSIQILEDCNCPTDSGKIHTSTPKYSKRRRTFRKKRRQEESQCHCGKIEEKPELLELKDKESTIYSNDNISSSTRMNDYNNTMFATPIRKFLRFTRRNNNSRKYPVTEETVKHSNRKRLISYEDQREQSADISQQDSNDHRGSFRKHTPKRLRKTNDDIPAASKSVNKSKEITLAPNDQVNNNFHDSVFQEIENTIPETSKSREKELKKWIQRCRRECEMQKKQ